jgi:hypothetical protein
MAAGLLIFIGIPGNQVLRMGYLPGYWINEGLISINGKGTGFLKSGGLKVMVSCTGKSKNTVGIGEILKPTGLQM